MPVASDAIGEPLMVSKVNKVRPYVNHRIGLFCLAGRFCTGVAGGTLPTIGVMRDHVAWQRLAPSLAWAQFAAMVTSFAAL
ncbi:hypothetical protein [Psychrobacter sp. KH172YL61]|uniref:hypothetical protein n=1 Tax=Psychrobacter sp. KH172YL61 TaxID=2517899 RepID=UPI001F085285|nr:hypothetical protein [Psychrobacter sp. KH172YL61]